MRVIHLNTKSLHFRKLWSLQTSDIDNENGQIILECFRNFLHFRNSKFKIFKIHERSQKGFSFQNSEMSQKGFRKCQISEISGLKSQVTGWFPYFTENVSISYFDTIIPIYIFLLIFQSEAIQNFGSYESSFPRLPI